MYKTTVRKAKERFDAMGYSLSRFNKIFDETKNRVIDYSSFLIEIKANYSEDDIETKMRIEKNVTFKKFLNSVKKIITYELFNGNLSSYSRGSENESLRITTECDKVIYYSLIDEYNESFYGIDVDCIDIAYVFRMILDCCPDEEEIILDFSSFANWDDESIERALVATDKNEKNIVLVEGTSDKHILEFALKYLYPHLNNIYYFMDFEDENGAKRDGSSSYLSKNLETFYFSKLKANFIGVFDNDAEGYFAKTLLLEKIQKWPDNFRIMCYPEIEFLKKYPTIIPNGSLVLDDINKKAASIELYLPDSIIKNNDSYYPIEWESRKKIKHSDSKVEFLYQGVISCKNSIKSNFFEKKDNIDNGIEKFDSSEWLRIDKILKSIIFAYK